MKTLHKLLAATAAALLCLLPADLRAQSISVSTTALTWTAGDTYERAILVSADYAVTWTVSLSNSAFIADATEGEGSDFIHVAPAAGNTSTADITAVLTVSTGGSSAQVSLTQFAPDPVERIVLAGNWILNRTYTDAAGTSSFEDITFYDGLGYARQVVQVGASPAGGKNIVTPLWYDSMRRADARTYLPYVSTNSTRVEESASTVFTAQSAWYEANGWSGQGDYAFSEQEYEASPLDRVVKARKPGSTYAKAVTNSKAVSIAYGTNTANSVRRLSVNSSGSLVIDGYHPAGTLHKTTVTDEDGSVTITWTDALGRTLRIREDNGNGVNINTYYVYDDAGHLRWVVSPEGSARLSSIEGPWPVPASANGSTSEQSDAWAAARYCYIYTWDGRGRQLSRKIPGKAVEYFVYDRAGRLVMSQDGKQRSASRWLTCKYDNAGRLVRRALLSSSSGRGDYQTFCDTAGREVLDSLLSAGTLLDSFVYGSYADAGPSSGLGFLAVSGVVSATDVDQSRIKGLKTYEKLARLSGTGVPSTYIERAFYYDSLGRLVQTVEKNAMGTVSRYSSKYDFLGNVVASREQHGNDYKTSAFTYDARGRQLSESTSVNGSVTATMAYAYDPLGRLKTTTSGSGTNAVATSDTWNIQGWLSSRSAVKGSGNSQTNIFSMSLGYYTPTITGSGTVPAARYSGDISSWTWTHGSGNAAVTRSYGFTYDGDHRLTDARYYTGTTASTVTNALSERNIAYDRVGNITALTRYDNSATPVATTLSYLYTGNRRRGYSFDVNGNVTSDATNNLQSSYNLINLPAQIKSGDTVKAKYTYLSDGTKAAAYTSANAGRDYAGSFTYTRGSGASKTLESVAFGGGRIRKTGSNPDTYAVDYYITDHLGSVRAIINAGGSVVEQNDYYPFGTRHSISGQPTLSGNRWRFAGKEEQDLFGIAYSDFGARLYDRTAWTAIDPMAEKYYSVSPYAYCNNNPVLLSDFDGMRLFINGHELFEEQLFDYSGKALNEDDMDDFERSAYQAIQMISQSKTGKALIERLQLSDFSFNIIYDKDNRFENNDVRGAYAYARKEDPGEHIYGAGGTIKWNSHGAVVMTTKGERNSPEVNLAHELAHADDAGRGLLDNTLYEGVKKGEWQAIYIENVIRQELKMPLRTHYQKAYDSKGKFLGYTGPIFVYRNNPIRPSWY